MNKLRFLHAILLLPTMLAQSCAGCSHKNKVFCLSTRPSSRHHDCSSFLWPLHPGLQVWLLSTRSCHANGLSNSNFMFGTSEHSHRYIRYHPPATGVSSHALRRSSRLSSTSYPRNPRHSRQNPNTALLSSLYDSPKFHASV
ncbi:hypothetical protein GGR50DRAFT_81509 [Xylaria sp. CBS 124048]|nr:hypothetical protein GGR50DRAFT_81509 [Xylaria sp. CBS 124048]